MFTDIKLQHYGVRIDILCVLSDELRNWDDINWAGNWVRYDMKFILNKCCKKSPSVTIAQFISNSLKFLYIVQCLEISTNYVEMKQANQTQICRYVVL